MSASWDPEIIFSSASKIGLSRVDCPSNSSAAVILAIIRASYFVVKDTTLYKKPSGSHPMILSTFGGKLREEAERHFRWLITIVTGHFYQSSNGMFASF